ncbi:Rv1355c family protein [Mycobacterium sp. 94-17]|uniref:Rv1355c family protein n=1 Tax=Mycobacterium sp. 94-17 TaxID=2986147 RepID=UPI002D1E7655|nr:Rv1355c family protein [Mycobacterium sp. 94-17]MEB4210056.1 Rv1355c family protein [Mycobacterium sp. 94-17]
MHEPDESAYRAHILDPADPADGSALQRLRADPGVVFIDHLDAQRANLGGLRPRPDDELVAEPARWAYFAWRRTAVAVLGPRGFRAVRLDRNRNNITPREQDRLGALRIGVAGLSVGHVIAHTLAAEGVCGGLRLADFDRLELSNLNRVPAGVLDLGVNKAHVAARRIAELDPYLPVEVYDAGLTPETIDEFVDGLDILVEECDALDMKAALRVAARARGIPVLMATSDRGLIDVERFDHDPRRPILHGLLGELDLALLPGMSSREKVRHVLRHLEAERLSPRVAASLVEIDRSLSTWPQLASDVVLGASVVTEAARRIGLGEELRSGRVRIDVASALEQLDEPDMARERPAPEERHETPELPGAAGAVAAAAIRAPSGGNVQPWRVHAAPAGITIELDAQGNSMMDVGLRGSAVALGAAVLNARVAAAAHHVLGSVTLTERAEGPQLRAVLTLADGTDPDLAGLYRTMLARETNRHHGSPEPIDTATVDALTAAARREGAALRLLTDRDDIAHAATILAESDRIRYLTPRLHQDMVSELRWPGDPDPDTGIDVLSLELDDGDLAVLDILRRPDVMGHLARWDAGSALGEDMRDRISASSALAVVSVHGQTLRDYAKGGSAVELVWIIAQQRGLSVQPVSPVFLYAHDRAETDCLSDAFVDRLEQSRREFGRLARVPAEDSIALVLRFAVGPPATVKSRRRLDRVRIG